MCYAVFMRIRRLNHSTYQIEYHLVWGTKFRRKILKSYVLQELLNAFKHIKRQSPDLYFIEINADDDHLHLMMEIPPKYAVSDIVCKIKAQSSAYLKKKFKFIRKMNDPVWATGYFVSTVGLDEAKIKKYIQLQDKEDRGVDVTDEFS